MDSLKINPKILAMVFISVVVMADLVPAPKLGPGFIVSSYNWVSSQVQDQPGIDQAEQKLRAKRSQSSNHRYNQ